MPELPDRLDPETAATLLAWQDRLQRDARAVLADLGLIACLERELTGETRLAILWIKEAWHTKPSYRDTVLSVDVYDAVLDHGVRTPAEFAAYLRERGKPDV